MLFPSKVNDYIVQYVLAIIVPYPISTSGIILLYQKCTLPPQKKTTTTTTKKQRAKIKVSLRITLTVFVELIIRQ